MIRKLLLLIVSIGLVCGAGPVVEKVSRGYHHSGKTYGKGEYYKLSNDMVSYMIYLQWVNVTAKSPPQVLVGVPEPWFFSGFLSRGYTSITVNGISSQLLEPKYVKPFNDEDAAGVELLYNFNGCRMFQRFYVTGEKPLLFMEWVKDTSSQFPLESAEVHVNARPSLVLSDYDYQRTIATASRIIECPEKGTVWAQLNEKDKYWIAYDIGLEPSTNKDAQGPCFLTADWNGVQSAKVWYGHVYSMTFRFTLDTTHDRWKFATAEFKKASDNAPFIENVRNNAQWFSIAEK